MTTELLIFVGYSQDARDEALAVCELKPQLQETLRYLNQVATTRSSYSTLEFFNWETGADVGIGGQSFAISPHLETAAIAIFVFKERVGPVTWEELNSCRNRPVERRIPIFALFPNEPPPANRITNREVARSWADLLDKRKELTDDWIGEGSHSVTPLEPYRDEQHLKDLLLKRISGLLPSLVVPASNHEPLEADVITTYLMSDGNYLDSIAPLAQCDSQAIHRFRSLMRRESRLSFPTELSDDEFLAKAGYQRSGKPTIAGALLFGRLPSNVIASALIRCSKYAGDDKATSRDWRNCDGPLLDQILDARDFIAGNTRRREMPVESSMQPTTSYEYPMVCIREILANAVCHRDYEDRERLIYVTIYSDRIEIKSPGSWASRKMPEGKSLKLSSLIGESVQRNMRLAHAISSVGMMEVEGSGIPTAVRDCVDSGALEPTVEWKDGYVIVTIHPRDDWDADLNSDASGQVSVEGPNIDLQQALGEVSRLKNQLQEENVYLQEEIKREQNFGEFIGQSDALKYVLSKIEQVALTDTTVLITGETGTGKELVARAIHNGSARSDRPLVKVNCAALAPLLIESELFGHEKGAFTGAGGRKTGRFELANGATIFLDEIGELPLELQVKLLRVIQEGRIERLGSSKTINLDIRIIAATNRNLEADVREGSFRKDLWYRLNVFPIVVPPLRDRKEDIPILVEHFVKRFSVRFGRTISTIPRASMRTLEDYSWPGNVRELANVLERAVITTSGTELRIVDLFEKSNAEDLLNSDKTLAEMEKEYILRILDNTSWRIEGGRGAARILGLHPSTLRRRMVKLGIRKPDQSALSIT